MTDSFDLASAEALDDPYPVYRALRERDPVRFVRQGEHGGMWEVTRYDDAEAVLKEPRIWKDWSRLSEQPSDPIGRSMLFQDPPSHTRLRALVSRAFTPRVVAELAPRVADIVTWLLDGLQAAGAADFIRDFAFPLPVMVIAEMLGVPAGDRERLRAWSAQLIAGSDPVTTSSADVETADEAMRALADYFDRLIRRRQGQAAPDLIGALMVAEEAGDRLSHEELLGMCVLLLVAGHETTANLLGNGLWALLRHPGEMARLRSDPSLAASAVEEMLRFDAPVQRSTFRFVGEATSVGGTAMRAGDIVSVVIGAANRDPAQFSEPDRFDVGRAPNRHLSFGRGIHFCLGAPLARLEARIAFPALLSHFATIGAGVPVRRVNTAFRGFSAFPVRLA